MHVSAALCLSGSEMYSDLCKDEGDDEFDRLLPSELIADIASCMNDDLPVSLEQFYEINRLIDADAEVESNASHPLLFGPDTVNSEVVRTVNSDARELESCDSDVVDASAMPDNSETFLFTVGDAIGEMDGTTSPESEMASIECEELYEESVSAEDVSSTISCEELQALMTSNCDRSVVKYEPSEDTETCRRSWCHPPTELTGNRRLRKKEQNKSAALRYRLKKRSEQGLVMTEYALLERRNIELRTRLDAMTKEISYLKSLIDELCPRDCA